MSGIPCPECKRPLGSLLPHVSQTAHVVYFRCESCGHVWNVPKWGNPGEPQDVTIPRKRESAD
jgi:uncharacterized Zn finger protein